MNNILATATPAQEAGGVLAILLGIAVFIGFIVWIIHMETCLKQQEDKANEITEDLRQKFDKITEEQTEQVKEIIESDPSRILFEITNQELKSRLIQHHGIENLLKGLKHKVVHSDDFGDLLKIYHAQGKAFQMYVKVVNGTPEPDGSFKDYYLSVPPDMETAKEAVAWTYGLHPDDYDLFCRT